MRRHTDCLRFLTTLASRACRRPTFRHARGRLSRVTWMMSIMVAAAAFACMSQGQDILTGFLSTGANGEHSIYYEVQGQSEPVVFIHGLTLDTRMLGDADFANAAIAGTNFENTTSRGFTRKQLYSTQSYTAKNLSGIGQVENNLSDHPTFREPHHVPVTCNLTVVTNGATK